MKLHRSQPTDLTPYIYRVGEEVSRQNFPDERVFEEPPEDRLDEMVHEVMVEPLFDYEQPTRRQIAYVLAGRNRLGSHVSRVALVQQSLFPCHNQ